MNRTIRNIISMHADIIILMGLLKKKKKTLFELIYWFKWDSILNLGRLSFQTNRKHVNTWKQIACTRPLIGLYASPNPLNAVLSVGALKLGIVCRCHSELREFENKLRSGKLLWADGVAFVLFASRRRLAVESAAKLSYLLRSNGTNNTGELGGWSVDEKTTTTV